MSGETAPILPPIPMPALDREKEGPHIFARIVVHIKMLYRLLSPFEKIFASSSSFSHLDRRHTSFLYKYYNFSSIDVRAKCLLPLPPRPKLSQLVSAIKSSDPVRTRALCDDITFDINDAVECDSDGGDDFPLQVALGKKYESKSRRRRFSLSPLFFFRTNTRKGGKGTIAARK